VVENYSGITAVIICFNEEHNIKRCLDSLQGVVNEIIVVDSFSSDKTPEICRSYSNVIFVQKPWENYSVAKNYGNSLAKYSHILSLDADEALSEDLRKYLIEQSRTSLPKAMQFARLTNYCGVWIRHCGWYPDFKIRLWRKDIATWQGIIHESLSFYVSVTPTTAKGDILHYSYYTINDHIRQLNLFTDLMAKDGFEKGKKATYTKIICSPIIKFIKSYFLQRGFLDGYYGFVVSLISAFATFIKYLKIRELHNSNTDRF